MPFIYTMKKQLMRISVRNLVEFIMRSGDLDSRSGVIDKDTMLKGTRIHKKIQKQMGSTYHAEVSLKYETEYPDLSICVEGRADGIFKDHEEMIIDEIKGTYKKVEKLEMPIEVHKAQAMCYAYIYAKQHQLNRIGVQLTYVNFDTEQVRQFRDYYEIAFLEGWYKNLLDSYYKWPSFELKWKKERNESMKGLNFPYSYRKGQKEVVTSVYHTIKKEKQIFIQAPTGTGKTISTIFPSVRAIGEGLGEKIFYLTARTIARTVAEDTFSMLHEKGLKFKVVTLTAKEKICLSEEMECEPEKCPYAKGHFDRINDAVFELLTQRCNYDREILMEHAKKWKVCPFELSLDLSLWIDGIICDYNYVFDPNVYLKRFFGENNTGKYIFLIDEAHNLADRGRDMYSASLNKKEVLEAKKISSRLSPKLGRILKKIHNEILVLQEKCDTYILLENIQMLSVRLLQAMGEMEKLFEESETREASKEILDFYFLVRKFLSIYDLVDENYKIYAENEADGNFRIKLFCVNPATNLEGRLDKGIAAVFFSATLLPMKFYQKQLSTKEDDFGIYIQSPFPKENRKILIGRDVSSRYSRRNDLEYKKIAEYINQIIWKKKGNYMVFFPSYQFMEEVYDVYEKEFSVPWITSMIQSSNMNEEERELFINEFKERKDTLVAFCIMGGIFSEGIDLLGEKLIGAIVVGTGLPQISNEKEILKKYYDEKNEDGFLYAYQYPGMNKVLQSAGRVIRSKEDQGVIVLLDDRFMNREYEQQFPAEWNDREICKIDSIHKKLDEFWKDKSKLNLTDSKY